MIPQKFEKFITEYDMFSEGDSVVCGISGGSDSVLMLYLLTLLREKWNIKINAAHINHMIRETASRDEEFVKNLCEKWNVALFVTRQNVSEIAKNEKISTELCGRNIRYSFFEEVAQKTGSSAILTAHNKNDNAETFLLHLLRGSGSGGLCGVAPKRDNICRPILFLSKEEIEGFLREKEIPWVEDETNKESLYTRNAVRNEIFPLLRRINPSAEDAILKASAFLKEDDDFLNALAENSGALEDGSINCEKLSSIAPPLAKRVVISALKAAKLEISQTTIEAVLNLKDKQSGKAFIFPGGGKAVKEYGKIVFVPFLENTQFSYKINVGEMVFVKEASVYASLTKEKPIAPYLALSGRCTSLVIRKPLPGDKFVPSGMGGHKKLSDFFADNKIPKTKRDLTPVFVFEEKIAAVGTYRADAEFVPSEGEEIVYLKIFNK